VLQLVKKSYPQTSVRCKCVRCSALMSSHAWPH
jgi:hypothetical protein